MKLSTAILVGGKSRRMMGQNKSFLKIKQQTFLEHLLAQCSSFDDVMLSVADPSSYETYDVKKVTDEFEDCGPLGGIYSCLNVATHDYLFVCATDMPFLTSELIEYMKTFVSSDYQAYVIQSGDQCHPLCAIYHKSALPVMKKQLESKNFKLHDMLSELSVKVIDLKYSCFDEQVVANINTPQEYQHIQAPFVCCVSGVKNSGKTTLVVKLIEKLKAMGYSVGTIKHDGHEFSIDVENTDTAKHRAAGSDATIIYSATQYALMKSHDEVEIETLLQYMKNLDIVIIEGMKHSPYLKIEVVREGNSTDCVCDPETLIAVATNIDDFVHPSVDVVSLDDVDALTTRLIERVNR